MTFNHITASVAEPSLPLLYPVEINQNLLMRILNDVDEAMRFVYSLEMANPIIPHSFEANWTIYMNIGSQKSYI